MPAKHPTIYNVTLTNANTEYSQSFPRAWSESFMIQCRDLADLKLSFTSGESGTNYITIPAGAIYTFNQNSIAINTLYFQSTNGVIVEVLVWE